MAQIDHLTPKILEKVKERLWDVSGSLKGLSALFTQSVGDPCFEGGEVFGIGQLLKKLSEEISILEDILTCGQDSMANERNGLCDESSINKGSLNELNCGLEEEEQEESSEQL